MASATEERAKTVIAADIRMFSGCEDHQTSADVSDVATFKLPDPAGRGGGACTSGLLQILHAEGSENLSFRDVCCKLRDNLETMGLSQIPQLSTSRPIDLEQPFHIVPEGSTGTRRAVMIGINYTGQDGELSGCQNDVKNMKDYLQEVHGFEEENIVLMLDDKQHLSPKRTNITKAIKKLVEDSQPGDVAFVHFSGHGGKVRDFDGDEEDGFDETLVPLDFEKSGQIRDDYLYKTLVCPLKEGVTLTCIFDCCHSGTVLDLPYVFRGDGKLNNPEEFNFDKVEQAAAQPTTEPVADSGDEEVEEEEEEMKEEEEEEIKEEEEEETKEEEEEEEEKEEEIKEEEVLESEPELEQEEQLEPMTPPAEPKPTTTTSMDEQSPVSVMVPPEEEEEEAKPSGNMQEVNIRCGNHHVIIQADTDDKILEIKKALEKRTGLPVDQQVLIYNGLNVRFKDDKSLRYYRCGPGTFFTLMQKKPDTSS